MKTFLFLIGIAAAGVLGYFAEPKLRGQLTGAPDESQGGSGRAATIDPASLAPNQLPEKVALTKEIKFTHASSGLMLSVAAGNEVLLLRIDGGNAIVQPGDTNYLIPVPISDTDLMQRLLSKPLPPPIQPEPVPAVAPESVQEPEPAPASESEPEPMPELEPAPAPAAEPAPEPEPAPESEPEPMPEAAPAPEAEAAPEPAPAPEPTPAPEPAPAVATAAVQPNVVAVMQESIRSGQIKEFRLDQVLEWKAGTNETLEGESFQTGTVSYKAETIFGVKTIQAKALIQDGKVRRWIWPKSGMEIR